jgi:signal transduction histidine kinase
LAGFLEGGGGCGALMRAKDWAGTPLGAVNAWPQSLRSALSICLGSRFPIVIYWGTDLVVLYNDAYAEILGKKHPWALGRPCREVWSEIWEVIAPMLQGVLATGEATWSEDQLLFLERRGYPEECYFSFSFSPVRGATGAVDGIFTAVIENTRRVLGERRLRTLRDLGSAVADARSAQEACRRAAARLADNPTDVPFAALYLIDEAAGRCEPVAATGSVDVAFDPEAVCRSGEAALFGESAPQALALPLVAAGEARPAGALVVGVSPRRELDEEYRGFFELIARRIAAAVADARAYEAERKRAEALAELDRAKTAFFSNVSHEFRTPLTLMLGPLAESLADAEQPLPPAHRERQEMVLRSALRLQKLVNTLLDFARLEAGRAQASYAPTDLAGFTVNLASIFRSAIEKAGLRLVVDCPRLPEPAYVDREMWEKIVLNLLSNAFKFTFEGEIAVSLRLEDAFVLQVRDTGTGIPAAELPRVFERFHRVEGAKSRTHEGTGIGLALVQELAKLHGGAVSVESVAGSGATFTVSIPRGREHLPAGRIGAPPSLASTALAPGSYVQEALGWSTQPQPLPPATTGQGARIVWADDNADMREYVRSLLAPRYEVETVTEGEAALAAARRRRPDLVLADVMMPGLDGLGLVRALRADPQTRGVPVILLSARVGEEARIEGLDAGADDYVQKPFSARELLARISARLELAALQRDLREHLAKSEARYREFLAMLSHELRNPLAPIRNALSLLLEADLEPEIADKARAILDRQVTHITRLVDDLLDITRISRGQIGLQPRLVSLAQIVAAALETSRPLVEARAHELVVRSAPPSLTVRADPVRLAQVISNLVNNAAKYTPPRGRVELEVSADGGFAAISVRDNGPGIAPEEMPRLFEMFTQGERTRARVLGGLGIGLALARQLAELHGGTLEGRSDGPGRGAEFTLRVPLHASVEPADPREIEAAIGAWGAS